MFFPKRLAPFAAVSAVLFSLAMVVVSQQPQDRRSMSEGKPHKRWEWAYEQRAYPSKEIPDDALELGWRRLQRWRDLPQKNGSFKQQGLQQSPGRWVNIGPAPILNGQLADPAQRRAVSGRVSDIAVDPANPNRWLIGAAQGGVWETRDAGATWTPLTDNQTSLSIGAIAFDPKNPQIIYAGTGEAVFGGSSPYAGAGLLKSVNGGGAWQLLAANHFRGLSFSDLRIDPNDTNTLLAAVIRINNQKGQTSPAAPVGGVFKSTDGGVNWVRTLGDNHWATDLETDPTDFRRQYAALGNSAGDASNGIYRSINAGSNWTFIDGPWRTRAGGAGRIELAMAPSNPKALYVSVQDAANNSANDNQLLGIWKTEDAWATPPVWGELTPLGNMMTERQWFYDHELIVDTNNPNVLYVGGVHLWKCSDTNARPLVWEQLDNKPDNAIHVDQHAMAWTPPPSAALNSQTMAVAPTLAYSTYLGGTDFDVAHAAAVDSAGNIYVTGETRSSGFPRINSIGPISASSGDIFVVKLDPTGSRVIYSTVIGGSSGDVGRGIAVDAAGNAYITGSTISTNFPVRNAYQSVKRAEADAFVAKLNSTGSELTYCSYLGGDDLDQAFDIAVNSQGQAWITGRTFSTNFPTQSLIQNHPGGPVHVFVAKFGANGNSLLFSTYLGGSGGELANSIALDLAGNAYVTGSTQSNNFRNTAGAYQTTFGGGLNDAFVACISAAHALVWSTYLGGSGNETGTGIAVDAAGSAYVIGSTSSANFPRQNPLQPIYGGNADAFITKLSPNGRDLVYSTFYGAGGSDGGREIAVDSSGNALIAGATGSDNLAQIPNPNPVQPGGYAGGGDAFVAQINAAGSATLFFTYLGGSREDTLRGMALDATGRNVYVAGDTSSTNFPTTRGALKETFSGTLGTDAFVSKIEVSGSPAARRLIVGNDGGVWSSADSGQTWADHNTNLAITQFYLGSLHPTDEDRALGGSQDNGTERWTGVNSWSLVFGGDGSANAFSSANPNTHWMVSAQNLDIRRTRDGVATNVTIAESGINDNWNDGAANNRAPFIARCEKCPNNDDVFIAGTDNVWRSNNFFSAATPSWTRNSPDFPFSITALAVAANAGCNVYAFGANNGTLNLTVNGGTSWTNIDAGNRVPSRWITDLAFHPTNPDVLYVTVSGFDEATPAQPGHLFKTENARSANPTWTNVSPPINLPHNTVAIDTANPRIVYAGTDMGVWKSIDAGVTWEHFGPDRGMPNITVNDIQISEHTGRIVAFTHGRGAFAFERNQADLAVTMTDTPDPVVFNQNLTYRLTVRNNGPDRATEVFVQNTLPENAVLVSATASQGTCAGNIDNVSCLLGALANGASATVTIIVRPPQPGTITNLARVSSDEIDPNSANNSASVSTQVVSPDLTVTKTHTPQTVLPGENISFSVMVRNAGMSDASGVTVTDTLPAGVTFVSSAATQGSCARTNNIVTCNLGSLARSASATVTIIVRADAAGTITNTASVAGNEPDSNPSNNTATDTLTVGTAPAISRITPASAARGATSLELKIEGAFFSPGAVISFSPSAGIEVLAVVPTDPGFISSAEIRRRINVLSNAPLGDRQMFVTNPNGAAGGVLPFNRFTVTEAGSTSPDIEITPASLNFGDLVLGSIKGLTVTCRNSGTAPLSVYEIRSSNPHFAMTSSGVPFTLAPGTTRLLSVSFTPTAASAQAGELIFSSNAAGKTTMGIPLRGNTPGSACTFSISPDNLSFQQSGGLGSVAVTTQSGCEWMVAEPPDWIVDNSFPFHTGSGSAVLTALTSTGPRTGMVAIAGRTLTVRQAEQVASVSAASFNRSALASESITAAFGQNLATGIFSSNTIPLPTSLGGTTLKVRDSAGIERFAPLFFVSPGQINYQAPPGATTGEALVTVANNSGQVSMGTMQIAAVAPGVFTANASGLGLAAAVALRVRADGSLSYESVTRHDPVQNRPVAVPIDLGPDLGTATDQVFLLLFGSGWRFRSSLSNLNLTIGGIALPVVYAGLQGDFVGLDQINVQLSRSLIGRGEVDVVLTVDGVTANTVKVNFK